MSNVDRIIALASRVAALRAELALAEGELVRRLEGGRAGSGSAPAKAPGPNQAPVSQRVRNLLHDNQAPLTFGEIVELMGGRSSSMATRSAIKKLREKKLVAFKGGKYSWVGK
jgi:hypothetical protein